jgi:NAD-dependent SIR2 family protein deacetylase
MNIFVLTGAGVSAESGLGTFRDKDGLWSGTVNLTLLLARSGV